MPPSPLEAIQTQLKKSAKNNLLASGYFFKTAPGSYSDHDQFIGVTNPALRALAKEFYDLPLNDLQTLFESKINEERLLALFILVGHYKKAKDATKGQYVAFYLHNLKHVNNWNLVDASAHLILGMHLLTTDKTMLLELAQSTVMWERRIAMVATWMFIRNNQLEWTFIIAKKLLNDDHDLIHKASGWMLREAGKKDLAQLLTFLNTHTTKMPRTMLRYAIEKLPKEQRTHYLKKKI